MRQDQTPPRLRRNISFRWAVEMRAIGDILVFRMKDRGVAKHAGIWLTLID
jgi:hypothetical protein